jgi:hypothetical protein
VFLLKKKEEGTPFPREYSEAPCADGRFNFALFATGFRVTALNLVLSVQSFFNRPRVL